MSGPIEDAIRAASYDGTRQAVIDHLIPQVLEILDRHPEPRAVDYETAASMLGVSARTIESLVASGELPRLEGVGRRRLVPVTAVDDFVLRHTPAVADVIPMRAS